jgi:hypothetical protein
MNGVVPPIPFDFDDGVHLGGHDEEASGKFGHRALLGKYAGLVRVVLAAGPGGAG